MHRRLDVQGNEHQPLADLLRPLVGQDEGAAPAVDLGDVRPTIPLNAPGDREPTGHAALLAWSWVTLAAAITSTMVSFVFSQMAIDRSSIWRRSITFTRRTKLSRQTISRRNGRCASIGVRVSPLASESPLPSGLLF